MACDHSALLRTLSGITASGSPARVSTERSFATGWGGSGRDDGRAEPNVVQERS